MISDRAFLKGTTPILFPLYYKHYDHTPLQSQRIRILGIIEKSSAFLFDWSFVSFFYIYIFQSIYHIKYIIQPIHLLQSKNIHCMTCQQI